MRWGSFDCCRFACFGRLHYNDDLVPVFGRYCLYAHKLHETNNTVKYHARFVVGWLVRKGCADSDADCSEIDRGRGLDNRCDRGHHRDHLGGRLDDHLGNRLDNGFDYHFGSSCFPEIDSGFDFDSDVDIDFRIVSASGPSSVASAKVVLEDWKVQTRC